MAKKLDLEKLKEEYIGKEFCWLTILDVIREDNAIKFVCKCKCGNIKKCHMGRVLHGSNKSCGCYQTSKEKAERYSQWCKDNPDKIKERSEKVKEYFKDHPEQLIEQGRQHSEWLKSNDSERYRLINWHKENPELSAKASAKRSQWSKDHPDLQKKINEKVSKAITDDERKIRSERRRKFYLEQPEKAAEMNKRISDTVKQFWKDHPDVLLNNINKRSITLANNPDIQHKIANSISEFFIKSRANIDFSEIINFIHKDYISDLLSGKIGCCDKVKTKCPVCGNYDEHQFGSIFSIKEKCSKNFPMCRSCVCSITSSKAERTIENYISTIYNGKCIRNIRSVISPFELDLYYPEKKIAIEFNGDYWHDENHKSNNYHYNKFKRCADIGIVLVSIFELEWNIRQDDVKFYLRDLFNSVENKLSYIKDGYISNNYPIPDIFKMHVTDTVEDYYTYNTNSTKVYTCGYSIR